VGFLTKHTSHRKAAKVIGTNVKKGDWYYSKVCRMLITRSCLFFVAMNLLLFKLHMVWLERMQGKWSNLPLCCICCSKDILCWNLKLLFKFLQVPENKKKHWSENSSWTMVEFMHQQVLKITRATMGVAHYVAFSCDKVSIVDN
jgi:hypothetical protein